MIFFRNVHTICQIYQDKMLELKREIRATKTNFRGYRGKFILAEPEDMKEN